MAAGLELYNEDGSVKMSLTDRLGRVVGSVQTGAMDGSLLDSKMAAGQNGEPFFALYYPEGYGLFGPSVSIGADGRISWSYSGASPRSNCTIVYGMF